MLRFSFRSSSKSHIITQSCCNNVSLWLHLFRTFFNKLINTLKYLYLSHLNVTAFEKECYRYLYWTLSSGVKGEKIEADISETVTNWKHAVFVHCQLHIVFFCCYLSQKNRKSSFSDTVLLYYAKLKCLNESWSLESIFRWQVTTDHKSSQYYFGGIWDLKLSYALQLSNNCNFYLSIDWNL